MIFLTNNNKVKTPYKFKIYVNANFEVVHSTIIKISNANSICREELQTHWLVIFVKPSRKSQINFVKDPAGLYPHSRRIFHYVAKSGSMYSSHPSWQGQLRGKKISMNSDFKKCYGDIYVIQNCKKQNKIQSHIGDSS